VQLLIRPPVRLGVRPTTVVNRVRPSSHDCACCQLLKTECDRLKLLLTVVVRFVDNTCGVTPKSNKRRPASYRSSDILVYSRTVLTGLRLSRRPLSNSYEPSFWKIDGSWLAINANVVCRKIDQRASTAWYAAIRSTVVCGIGAC